jgi:uncharacterized protein Veg
MPKATIMDIRREVENYLGRRVKLEAHKSKKKLYQKEGIIAETYPSIFTVRVKEDKRKEQKLSFSYSDLLTQSVKIVLLDDGETEQQALVS